MNIDNSVDVLQIGSNLLSQVVGLQLLQHKKRILIIDDVRASYGDWYLQYLSEIEVILLRDLGKRLDVTPLREIDNFLKQTSIVFSADGKMVRLGGTYDDNYRELSRKFPALFTAVCFKDHRSVKTFFDEIRAVSTVLVDNIYSKELTEYFDENLFLQHFSQTSKEMLNALKSSLNSEEFTTFASVAGAIFQGEFTLNRSSFESYHLIISLLSPYYYVDQILLEKEVNEVFKERGGLVLKGRVNGWSFDANRPWAFEMDGVHGIIRPNVVVFAMSLVEELPIKSSKSGHVYRGLKIVFKESDFFAPILQQGVFVFARKDLIATEMPAWLGTVNGDGNLEIIVLVAYSAGMKEEFIISKAVKKVETDLKRLVVTDSISLKVKESGFSHDIFLGDYGAGISPLKKQHNLNNFTLVDNQDPSKSSELKDVYYVGPSVASPIGPLSTVIGIMSWPIIDGKTS